jgi:hypothetical protein
MKFISLFKAKNTPRQLSLHRLGQGFLLIIFMLLASVMSFQPLAPLVAAEPMTNKEKEATVGWTNWVASTGCDNTGDSATVETGNSIPDEDIPGQDNRQKIWNYLISLGFTPVQAAGIVGNIGAEGVYDPQSIENGNEKIDPDTGRLVGRTKNFEVFKQLTTPGQDGYGLIGFTPGASLMGLASSAIDWSEASKVNVTRDNFYLISTQLDVVNGYMKHNTDADSGNNMMDEYKRRATSPENAADAFMTIVENPGILRDGVRESEARKAMQDFGNIPADAVPTASQSVSGTRCCPPGGSGAPGATAEGSDPETTIWNYLVGEMELSSTQAAGIMGNIEQESGFSPTAENPSSGAYGIIQWLGGRLTGLESLASQRDKDKSNIDVQLEFMKSELEGSYKSTVLNPIKASNDLEEVTRIWLEHFEIPCTPGSSACDDEMNIRLPNARAVLQKYGDGVVPGVGAGSTECPSDSEGTPGANGWELQGPNAMVYYGQCDPKWANVAYGTGKSSICEGGCGITSMAMVVATLSSEGKNETPETLAKKYGDVYHTSDGTSWALWPVAARDYGLQEQSLGTDLNKAADIVKAGGLVIISVDPGEFTSGGHIMVIRAVTDDGKFLLADPNNAGSPASNDTNKTPYSADFLRTQGSLKGLWSFTK